MTDQGAPIGSAPGWYTDPLRRHQHRYWDGAAWTHHVSSDGRQSVDPLDAAPVTAAGTAAQAERSEASAEKRAPGRWRVVLGSILTASAIFLLLAGLTIAIATPAITGRIMQPMEDRAGVSIFIGDAAARSDVDALQQKLAADPLVESVRYVSKEEALAIFTERTKATPELVGQLKGNPLPASLELTLKDPRQVETVAATIKADPLFLKVAGKPDDLKYAQEPLQGLFSASRVIAVSGWGLVVVAIVVGVLAALVLTGLPPGKRLLPAALAAIAAVVLFSVTAVGAYVYFRVVVAETMPFIAW